VSKKTEQSISRAGFAESVGATKIHTSFRIPPSHIRSDHYADNHNRAAMYSLAAELPELAGHLAFADDRFCFTRAEVLDRAANFENIGQSEPVTVYRSNTHLADLAAGFLRHAAGVYLEVTGRLAACPGMQGKLECRAKERPTDMYVVAAENTAENIAKPLTPIDRAWTARRFQMLGKTPEEIGALFYPTVSGVTVNRYLALLGLTPQEQLDVHEGRVSYMAALAKQSERGRGTAKGPRAGVPHSALRFALAHTEARPLPTQDLTAGEVATLLAVIAGTHKGDVPERVAEWARAAHPDAAEIKAAKPKRERKAAEPKQPKTPKAPKKAPPRAGEKTDEAPTEGTCDASPHEATRPTKSSR